MKSTLSVKSLKSYISDVKLTQIIKTPTHASTHYSRLPENNVFLHDHRVVDKAITDYFLISCDINIRKPVTILKREIISRNLKAIDRDKFRCDISCALQTAEIEVDTLNTIQRNIEQTRRRSDVRSDISPTRLVVQL